ncbi:MAG: type I-E CRISPR-associated protein Cas7/Cse4/CasC [Polyangiaceae bacterium]
MSHTPLFLQVHTLTSYAATLLNRDDQGFAKRVPFGGVTRTRISSQCLKRHWRTYSGAHSMASLMDGADPVTLSVRSRHTFERFVVEPLVRDGVSEPLARAATEAVMVAVLGESAKAKKAKEEAKEGDSKAKKRGAKKDDEGITPGLMTGQITVFGKPEIDYFLSEARALANAAGAPDKVEDAKKARFTKDWGKNLEGLKRASGLDAALFGRMVTSDRLARSDAAVHVAHALTVHAEHAETDYFSAIDDLLRGGDGNDQLGSGHIGNTELTSGIFYGYVVVDVAQLVSNVEGCDPREWLKADRKLSADVVHALTHLVATVSPGAKLGSTAPYAFSHLTMLEAGSSQPRTLANAFLKPVSGERDLLGAAYAALASYTKDVDSVFDLKNRRALAAIGPKEVLAELATPTTLDSVAKFAANAVLEHA